MNIKEIEQVVKEYDSSLKATDPRFCCSVMVLHEEGTTLYFENAFAIKIQNWFVIFTEHHRYHIYDSDDVQIIMRGARIKIPEYKQLKKMKNSDDFCTEACQKPQNVLVSMSNGIITFSDGSSEVELSAPGCAVAGLFEDY